MIENLFNWACEYMHAAEHLLGIGYFAINVWLEIVIPGILVILNVIGGIRKKHRTKILWLNIVVLALYALSILVFFLTR